ncbi:MAG: response regulator [Spirochaetes bacterium]|nr:response regulator [Spirochaetota bacterium]
MADVLIVDDSKFMRLILTDILNDCGHTIAGEAGNAKEAVELFKNLKPDLVTLDIIMPEVGGIDAATALKKIMEIDESAKVLMVSAMDQEQMISGFISAGACGFLIKPFQRKKVKEAVEKVLKSA